MLLLVLCFEPFQSKSDILTVLRIIYWNKYMMIMIMFEILTCDRSVHV